MKAAVIGAGAAGLVSARELHRAGLEVTIFEQSAQVGGVWVYQAEAEDDPLGLNPSEAVFSSLYDSLRTNLPRDLMAFGDYTFDSAGGGQDDWQRFPHHSKVLKYLQNFAADFELLDKIKFETKVTALRPASSPERGWLLSGDQDYYFDAVVICNGHYSKPKFLNLTGIENFQGQLIHSHNYRNAEPYKDKVVAMIGTSASGMDISQEVAQVAKAVLWCGSRFELPATALPDGRTLYPNPTAIDKQGQLCFGAEVKAAADVLMYCTGYQYEFPFLDLAELQIDDNWVHPLYKDIVPPSHPSLAFIGLPFLVVPFPLFEMQAKWFASLLAGGWKMPDATALAQHISAHETRLKQKFKFKRHYHQLGSELETYVNDLAEECGAPPLPDWFQALANAAEQARMADPLNFRDQPVPGHGPTKVID